MKGLPRRDVLVKQVGISAIPFLLAVGYSAYNYVTVDEDRQTLTVAINYFAAAFFFLMWLVGQYLRTEKQIDDTSNYENLQATLQDVKNSVSEIHSARAEHASALKVANPMLQGADRAVRDGHVLAGLMQAGVAFEQAVIEKAKRVGIHPGKSAPTAKLLRDLSAALPEALVADLLGVWRLRNQLMHLTPEAAREMEQQPHLLGYFVWAVSELEQ